MITYKEYYEYLKELEKHKKNKMKIPHNMREDEFLTRIEFLENKIREYNKSQRN